MHMSFDHVSEKLMLKNDTMRQVMSNTTSTTGESGKRRIKNEKVHLLFLQQV
jgi:hypothetical protein